MKILCIDDEADIVALMAEFLQLLGHSVVTAENGRQGYDILTAAPEDIDLVISDVKMPEMGGFELLRLLRHQGHATPVVLVSGHNDGSVELEALDHGGVAVLSKPFDLIRLQKVVEGMVA